MQIVKTIDEVRKIVKAWKKERTGGPGGVQPRGGREEASSHFIGFRKNSRFWCLSQSVVSSGLGRIGSCSCSCSTASKNFMTIECDLEREDSIYRAIQPS